jgi:hypothetical protein
MFFQVLSELFGQLEPAGVLTTFELPQEDVLREGA